MLSSLFTMIPLLLPFGLASHSFGTRFNNKSRVMNETIQTAIHIPLYFSDQQFRAQILVGDEFTEFHATIETSQVESWVSSWSGGGYSQKGQKLPGSFSQDLFGGLGSITGALFRDNIYIKGRATDDASVWIAQDVTFGVTDTSNKALGSCPAKKNCAASLGFDSAPVPTSSEIQLFETLFQSGAIRTREIGIYYPPSTAGSNATGQLSLGGVDVCKYAPENGILTASVTAKGNWSFEVEGLELLNGTRLSVSSNRQQGTIMSSLPYMVADLYTAMRFHAAIPGARIFTINGNNVEGNLSGNAEITEYHEGAGLENYTFNELASVSFLLPCDLNQSFVPSVIINGTAFSMPVPELVAQGGNTTDLCPSVLAGVKYSPWLFGMPWLRSFYTVLNWGTDTNASTVGAGATVGFSPAMPYMPYQFPSH